MSYQEAYRNAWKQGPRAALALVRHIFHEPTNQHVKGKPTDYLSDRHDRKLTPAQGFDKMVAEFSPRQSIEEKVDFLMECLMECRDIDQDQGHRVTPFNALLLTVGTYDWGDATVSSIHYEAESGRWKSQYGLNHELLDQADNYRDDSDWYTFIYDLENSDHYELCHEGEVLAGEMLFTQVRAAQYAVYLSDLVDALARRPDFADFPKALPIHFVLDEASWSQEEGTLEHKVEWRPPLDEAALGSSELFERYVEAAVPPPELSRDERWLYLLKSIRKPETPQYAQLVAMLASDDEVAAWSLEVAENAVAATAERFRGTLVRSNERGGEDAKDKAKAQSRRVPLRAWALLFWTVPGRVQQALCLTESIFALPSPILSGTDREIKETCKSVLSELYGTWKLTIEEHKETFRASFDAARDKLRGVTSPVFRVLLAEQEMRHEHDRDTASAKRRGGISYNIALVSDDLIEAVVACLDELLSRPDAERDFDFVLERIRALGTRAQAATPALLRCLDELETGSYRTNRLLDDLPKVFFELGLDRPPKRIREHVEGQQYNSLDFYKEWATRVPKAQWAKFVASFRIDSSRFEDSIAWMDFLTEGKHAKAIFHEGILGSENREEMLATLTASMATPAPKLVTELLYGIVQHYFARAKTRNLPKVVALLSGGANLDEENRKTLRHAELVLYREAIDRGEPNLEARLIALQQRYKNSPALSYCETELALEREGAKACGRATLKALRELSEDDLVYRKAVFQFSNIESESWDDATPFHGYAIYSWASTFFAKDSYRDGSYSDGPKYIDRDLFFLALEKLAAPLSEVERHRVLEAVRSEYDLGPKLHTSSLKELKAELTAKNWNITYQVAKKLVDEPAVYVDALLSAYGWFRGDETQRRALVATLWPVEALRQPLLGNSDFQEDLAKFIQTYAAQTKETCDSVFGLLARMGLDEVIVATAEALDSRTVVGSFLSVNRGIQTLGAFERGVAILDRILEETSEQKPEFVLLTTNKGVLQFQQGKPVEAEATFDKLFAMDWTRFDYKTDDNNLMSKMLGGDLDAQLAQAFNQYYAQAKYNAACIYAARTAVEPAVAALRETLTRYPAGYPAAKLHNEPDLDPIRSSPAFVDLLESLGEP